MRTRGARIALYSTLFLFFFQLMAEFVEAIYAFGLLVGGLPIEMISVLFLLSPVILLLLPRGLAGVPLLVVGEVMLICRVVEPLLDTRGRMLIAGLGVACFLLLLPILIRHGKGTEDGTQGLTLGIGLTTGLSLSILFRVLGSGSDISTFGWSQVVGWILAAMAGVLLASFVERGHGTRFEPWSSEPDSSAKRERPGFWRTAALALGIISVLTLLYFSFSSPNVIVRWTGANYPLVVSIVVILLSVSVIVLTLAPHLLSALRPNVVLAWNVLFVLTLVLTIRAHQISFPASAGTYPLAEPAVTPLHHLPLFLMLILFPVILVDFVLFAQDLADWRPSFRQLGGAFALASLFFLLMIFAQIFTTVYDYIPVVGPFFRDKFWLVYLMVGIALVLPLLLVRRRCFALDQAAKRVQIGPALGSLIVIASLATISAAYLTASRPVAPGGPRSALKILSYNILQGYNEEGLRNYDGQLKLMRAIDADIIGLQESDTNRIAGGNADLVRFYADRLDMYSYYGPKTVVGTFGIALLSKYPIEDPETFFMPGKGEQTAAIEARIPVGDRTFQVFVTHLGSEEPEPPGNMPQQEAILARVQGKENVILLGDFNFGPDTEQYGLTATMLDDSWTLRWPDADKRSADFKGEGIDHIFVSPGTTVVDAQILPDRESDHPAVTAVVGW